MNNDSVTKDSVKPFVIDVCINDRVLKFQVDTGSPATIVLEDKLVHFGKQVEDLKPFRSKLKAYTGDFVDVLGETMVTVRVNGVQNEAPVTVVRDKGPNLIGRDWFMLFSGLVQDLNHSSVVNKLTLSDVLESKDEIFAQDLGALKGTKARIHVDANAQPKFCKARSVAYTLQEIHSFAAGKLYHHSMFHNPTAAVNLFHVGKQYLTFYKG